MDYKNILIIKMSSMGDILHTLPFAAALRKRFPEAKISWLVHPQFAGFVPDPPVIDEVLFFDRKKLAALGIIDKLRYLLELRRLLHNKKFDLVIDMQGLFKSALMAALSGCSERIGYCELREGSGLVSKRIVGAHAGEHVIERYLDVARYLGAEADAPEFPFPDVSAEAAVVREKLRQRGLPADGEYVVLAQGTRWRTKEWLPEYYGELAQKLSADGYAVVLAGGADEAAKGEEICRFAADAGIVNMIGATNFRELAALIRDCKVFISGDTGPLHFASALQKPLLAMYGPTLADRTGPYGNKNAVVLVTPAECAGCLKKQCSDWYCMERITPETVYREFKELICRLS